MAAIKFEKTKDIYKESTYKDRQPSQIHFTPNQIRSVEQLEVGKSYKEIDIASGEISDPFKLLAIKSPKSESIFIAVKYLGPRERIEKTLDLADLGITPYPNDHHYFKGAWNPVKYLEPRE